MQSCSTGELGRRPRLRRSVYISLYSTVLVGKSGKYRAKRLASTGCVPTYNRRPPRAHHTTSRLRATHTHCDYTVDYNMKQLLLLVALCTLAAAMVPRERRAPRENGNIPICPLGRPCGWDFYSHQGADSIYKSQTNKVCQCSADKTCQRDENDTANNAWIKRCKTPVG